MREIAARPGVHSENLKTHRRDAGATRVLGRTLRGVTGWVIAVHLVAAGCNPSSPMLPPGLEPMVPSGSGGFSGGSSGSSSEVEVFLGCEPAGAPADSVLREMYRALNNYRRSSGRDPLAYSSALEAAAGAHAEDLYLRDFFDHINPDAQSPFDRVVMLGFCEPTVVGENIAEGQLSVTEVQSGWEQSPGHDANMLDERFTFVGMGHYTSPEGREYWVQVFARSQF